MKALMSVAALIGAVGILLLAAMTVGIVPSNTVRLLEGYMPVQVVLELILFVAGFTGISYMMAAMGMAFPRFWQGILMWAFVLLYLKFRIYPRFRSAFALCMGRSPSWPFSCGFLRTKKIGRSSSSRS
jgi:hypothetical protein